MDKILEIVSVTALFKEDGSVKPSYWFYHNTMFKLLVLQQDELENDIVRYTCRSFDDDEWTHFMVKLIFNKSNLKWYLEE